MRKPKDFDAELKVLDQRARLLKTRQRDQLGDLVIATGAATLPVETLAGALLATATADVATKEAWRTRGVAFFRGEPGPSYSVRPHRPGAAPVSGDAQPADGGTGAA